MEVRWKGAVASLVMAGGLLLSGCTQATTSRDTSSTTALSSARSGRPAAPLTNAQMLAVVAATMSLNNKANKSLDLGILKSYESGSALAIDAAGYSETAAAAGGGRCSYLPFSVKVRSAMAEGGLSYPQRFIVVASQYSLPAPGCSPPTGSCPNPDWIYEFERARSGAPWKIALEPSVDTGDSVHLAADGGVAGPLTPSETTAVEALPHLLAADLERYEATGDRGPLQASYFTGSCWLIPDPHTAYEQYANSGVSSHEAYSPASDQVSVPSTGEAALTVFTLDFETRLVPVSAGGTIDWISDPSSDPATALLATGPYKRIVEKGAVQIAAETGSDGRFTVIGAYFGFTSVTGTPGSPSEPGGNGGVLVSYRMP
jgi:hypothetical protein